MSRYSFKGCTSPSISGPDSYPSGRSSDSSGGHAWMAFSYHNGHVVSWNFLDPFPIFDLFDFSPA